LILAVVLLALAATLIFVDPTVSWNSTNERWELAQANGDDFGDVYLMSRALDERSIVWYDTTGATEQYRIMKDDGTIASRDLEIQVAGTTVMAFEPSEDVEIYSTLFLGAFAADEGILSGLSNAEDAIAIDPDNDGNYSVRWGEWDYIGYAAPMCYGPNTGGTANSLSHNLLEFQLPLPVKADRLVIDFYAVPTGGPLECAFVIYGDTDLDGTAYKLASAEELDWSSAVSGNNEYLFDTTPGGGEGEVVWFPAGVYYLSTSCCADAGDCPGDNTGYGTGGSWQACWGSPLQKRSTNVGHADGGNPDATIDIDGKSWSEAVATWFAIYLDGDHK
jgi:hypothetical protein